MSEQAAASSAVSTGTLVVKAVLRTDVGKVRSENQDFGTYTTLLEESGSHPGGRLLVVADGMGGHRGGATASRLAAETVKAQYLGSETADIPTALREALTRANARIHSEAQANPDLRGMGTTTSALAVRDDQAWYAHVGDSRIYLVRGQEITQLTDDHSLVASMVREGLLTQKEADVHPRRNVLQRSMGVGDDVEIDVRGPYDVQEGDTFILCSDGLHGLVKEPELTEVAALPIEQAADEFLKRALERGAPDNVTVIVARIERMLEGERTLREHKLDETLDLDTMPFDETVRDATITTPATALADPVPVEPVAPAAAPAPAETSGETPAAAPAATPAAATTPVAVTTTPSAVPMPAVTPIEPAVDPSKAPTLETPVAEPKPESGVPMWLLIVVLIVLGAAGAWIYLYQPW